MQFGKFYDMLKKSEIIEEHRKHLIGRLLSRNPLLRFNPPEKSNQRIDICDFRNESQPNLISDNQTKMTPACFFQQLIEQGKSELQDAPDKLLLRLKKMKAAADDRRRATGLHPLFIAWPFVQVPWEGRRPLAAPLLFWQIDIEFTGKKLTVSLQEDGEPDYNFMLKEWLKIKKEKYFDFSCIGGGESGNMDEKIKQINKIAKEWKGCENELDSQDFYKLQKYADCADDTRLAIFPCAVIGIAHFSYLKLLRDLEKLANNADSTQCGLLGDFLGGVDVVSDLPLTDAPKENDKFIIEQTDTSQEQAVWRARDSKIMLLDGPPGTGKSQTIVNLIADALQKNEKVALICRKPTALDVVKKRLDARKNLGDLAVKIINPISESKNIIRKMIEIKDSVDNNMPFNFESSELKNYNTEIPKLEMRGDNIAKSWGTGKDYSIRGHLRGKMIKIGEKTKFYPVDTQHEEFVKLIIRLVENFSEDRIKKIKESLTRFAEDYEKCNYEENPWKKARIAPEDIFDFLNRFKPLVQMSEKLDAKKNNLPNERILPILFGDIIGNFAHSFYEKENRETAKEMARLITGTKRIFDDAKISPVPPIWKKIYEGKGGKEYENYITNGDHLERIVGINNQIQESEIIRSFKAYTENNEIQNMKDWGDILESILCYLDEEKIPKAAVGAHSMICKELKEFISYKRDAEAVNIRQKFGSQRQHIAVNFDQAGLLRLRRFRNRIPSTIRDICRSHMEKFSRIFPVLLMDPDAMCQILPLEPEILDLVIVDEASQMFVADALPIFYRAKKVVISGDNMQMPPNDTFALQLDDGQYDDDDSSDTQESENLPSSPAECWELLEAMDKWIPPGSKGRCKLSVHYRSRPAELIAFSNHAFYDGNLQAAPDNFELQPPLKTPIQVIHAPGVFENNVNKEEIREIIKCLKEIWRADNAKSVGVIVFNIKQAELLRETLEEECKNDKNLEELYQNKEHKIDNEGEDVSFFVRSVEHVQGDERDIIILGTTYNNKGSYGKLSEKEKGRRRLNVAVTRAKHGIFVITSLNINQISNEGERPGMDGEGSERWYLWKFMEYARAVSSKNAESAAKILKSINNKYDPRPIGQEPESQFEKDVGDFIRNELGYKVDYQIGEGKFRIDLGVKRREDARYLCGIECDGRIWHEGWLARHRDIWRQEILENKGWKIYRIWSDHWYSPASSKTTKEKLKNYLSGLCNDK